MHTTIFNEALELVERLNRDDQEKLLEILRLCLIDKRREEIALNAKDLKRSFTAGKARRGSIDDLRKALQE
jgi:hypothetical protein